MNEYLTQHQKEDLIKFLQTVANDFIKIARNKLKINVAPIKINCRCDYFSNAFYLPHILWITFTDIFLDENSYEDLIYVLGHELGHHIDYTLRMSKYNGKFPIHTEEIYMSSMWYNSRQNLDYCKMTEFLADELSITLFNVPVEYGLLHESKTARNDDYFEDQFTHPSNYERTERLMQFVNKDNEYYDTKLVYKMLTG